MAEIFNTTINRIVDVPDGAVDAYLAQDAYRKVTKADRTPDVPDTISRTEHDALVAQAVADALTKAAVDAETAAQAAATPPVGA